MPPLPRLLLVPTDFSACGVAAIGCAAALADTLDARVYVAHVISVPVFGVAASAVSAATLIDQLQQQAEAELHADLIVTGTHGRRGWRRLVLGSVAESVVRTAPCAVLAARAA